MSSLPIPNLAFTLTMTTSFLSSIACFSLYLNLQLFTLLSLKIPCGFSLITIALAWLSYLWWSFVLTLLPPISQLLVSQASTSGLHSLRSMHFLLVNWRIANPELLLASLAVAPRGISVIRLDWAPMKKLCMKYFKVSVLVIINGFDKRLCSLKLTFTSNSILLQAFLRNECKFLEVYKVNAYNQRFKRLSGKSWRFSQI